MAFPSQNGRGGGTLRRQSGQKRQLASRVRPQTHLWRWGQPQLGQPIPRVETLTPQRVHGGALPGASLRTGATSWEVVIPSATFRRASSDIVPIPASSALLRISMALAPWVMPSRIASVTVRSWKTPVLP